MVMLLMLLSEEDRKRRIALAADRLGGKAALGRALGYKDGAFVGQMIRGERPITEKTIKALADIHGLRDLFSFNAETGFQVAENDGPPLEAERDDPIRPALRPVLQAIADLPMARWASVRAQFDQVAAHPEMLDAVLEELELLLNTSSLAPQSSVTQLIVDRESPKRRITNPSRKTAASSNPKKDTK